MVSSDLLERSDGFHDSGGRRGLTAVTASSGFAMHKRE